MNIKPTRAMLLTPNFRLGEFLHQSAPIPSPEVIENLTRLANRLQVVRDILNRPIIINSGYRTAEHNAEVGGEPTSYHLSGMAADIVIKGMTAHEVQAALKNWSGGMGSYATFTHLDIRHNRARWQG